MSKAGEKSAEVAEITEKRKAEEEVSKVR